MNSRGANPIKRYTGFVGKSTSIHAPDPLPSKGRVTRERDTSIQNSEGISHLDIAEYRGAVVETVE